MCECELVTRAMLEQAAVKNPTVTLDDLRRDVRLGMGPCQGGFCTYPRRGHPARRWRRSRPEPREGAGRHQAADRGIAVGRRLSAVAEPQHRAPNGAGAARRFDNPNLLLRDFLQERWRGLTPILWGQQLKQERLDELIYLSIMNVDHLPPDDDASPLTEFWQFDTTPGATATTEGDEL